MSTWWYYQCASHTPALRSEEFTQHTDDEHFLRGVELANARPLDPEEDWRNSDAVVDSYYEGHVRSFLLQHPHCRLLLVSETGAMRTLEDPTQTFWQAPAPSVSVSEGKVRLSHVSLSAGPDSLVLSIEANTKRFEVSMTTGSFGGANNPRAGQSEISIYLDVTEHSLRTDESTQATTEITLTLPEEDGWVFSLDGGGRYGARLIGVRQNALQTTSVYSATKVAQD